MTEQRDQAIIDDDKYIETLKSLCEKLKLKPKGVC